MTTTTDQFARDKANLRRQVQLGYWGGDDVMDARLDAVDTLTTPAELTALREGWLAAERAEAAASE